MPIEANESKTVVSGGKIPKKVKKNSVTVTSSNTDNVLTTDSTQPSHVDPNAIRYQPEPKPLPEDVARAERNEQTRCESCCYMFWQIIRLTFVILLLLFLFTIAYLMYNNLYHNK
ncbi:unnamed protein product [Bursaphelenchus okinawaensis]|uniref:Uncharacterized protein n=1 Tax=Bursaphelenchus okinawaensis TaxID=465554 RepID=A0A811L6Z4_9BILA|nr:unnamed protein product [Bursaphelenchus okinawaensis]CAG9119544.1 unnamed protein product [Bursaphelenchus okinawaensis]